MTMLIGFLGFSYDRSCVSLRRYVGTFWQSFLHVVTAACRRGKTPRHVWLFQCGAHTGSPLSFIDYYWLLLYIEYYCILYYIELYWPLYLLLYINHLY